MKNKQQFYAFEKRLGIDLSLSENPLGCSPRAMIAAKKSISQISQYPDPMSEKLRIALSRKFNISKKEMIFGNGSESLIDLVCRSFINGGDETVVPKVTFWIFEASTKLNGGKPVFANLTKEMEINLDVITNKITKKTKIIFICNPNNPTGKVLSSKKLIGFVKNVDPVIVVVDEAIIEFAGTSLVPQIKNLGNLIVLRTFSKAFGLAGVRFGVAFTSKKNIAKMQKFIQPFPINKVAQEAVLEALKDKAFINRTRRFVKEQREMLSEKLEKKGLIVFQSQTNNLLIKIAKTKNEGEKFIEELNKNNVSVVNGNSFKGLDERFIRISIRDETTNKKFLKVIKRILAANRVRMLR